MEDPPPLAEPPSQARAHNRDWFGMIVSLAAITTSAVSIMIAVQNASSMDRLVQANSWPYLEFETGNNSDGRQHLSVSVRNSGVGPLKLQSLVVSYEGADVGNIRELLLACCVAEGVTLAEPGDFSNIGVLLTSNPTGAVLAPGDEVLVFGLPFEGSDADVWRKLDAARFRAGFRACYCSVFDECWTTDFRTAKRETVKACRAEEKSWRG